MKNLCYVLLVLLFVSCGEKENDYVLAKNEMVPIMVDMYIATELVSMAKLPLDSASLYFKSVYKPNVLKKYQIDIPRFDSSFKYYSSRPEDFVWLEKAVADSLRVKHLQGRIDY